jgi:hypothetical protein
VPKANLTIKRRNITIVIERDHVSEICEEMYLKVLERLPMILVGQGLRRNKAQGSARAGIHCTSSMKVEIQTDEHITVQYYPAHYGHTNLSAADEQQFSEQNRTNNATPVPHHHQDHGQTYQTHAMDRSPSLSPGSSSTSPSGGSNSNSNHPSVPMDRHSVPTLPPPPPSQPAPRPTLSNYVSIKANNTNAPLQNPMSHCIIITPSLMLDEHPSIHSNDHHTPVFVIQQHLPMATSSSSSSSSGLLPPPTANLAVKKGKCVSDIMHEAFQLLSYWPLDQLHQNGVSSENDQQMYNCPLSMDEHLMF